MVFDKVRSLFDITQILDFPGYEVSLESALTYNTIQYKFYCQLPMGAFQRQILIVQVIKKNKQTNKQTKKKNYQ